MRHLREGPPAVATETRTEIVTPATSDTSAFALSPDGRQIAFVASGDGPRRLWVRSLAATTARPLEGTDGAGYPFWSPDSRSLGFFVSGQLKRLDLDGGAPRTLTPAVAARGGTWGTEDVILFAPSPTGPLERVAGSGGDAVQETTLLDWQTGHRFPVFLPDGRHFIFYAEGPTEPDGIFLGEIGSATTTRLTDSETAGAYLPPGWVLWVREGTLVAQRLDLDRLALTGDQVTVAEGVAVQPATSQGTVAASPSGLIAYRTGKARQRQLTWFDRTGEPRGTLGEPGDTLLYFPRVSPDGRQVVLGRTVQGNTDLWVQDGPRLSRFTFAEGIDNWPNWSPDGRRIVFSSIRTGVMTMYERNVGAEGGAELLIDSAPATIASDWSHDGRFLLYNTDTTETDTDIWVLPMSGDAEPWIFLKTPFRESWGVFSRDDRWVAYQSNQSGRLEIYVRPFAPPTTPGSAATATGGERQVSSVGGSTPAWRADGQELYYLAPDGTMMAVSITSRGTEVDVGPPAALFPTRIAGGGESGRQYDLAPDGRFLLNTLPEEGAATPITLIQNWRPE